MGNEPLPEFDNRLAEQGHPVILDPETSGEARTELPSHTEPGTPEPAPGAIVPYSSVVVGGDHGDPESGDWGEHVLPPSRHFPAAAQDTVPQPDVAEVSAREASEAGVEAVPKEPKPRPNVTDVLGGLSPVADDGSGEAIDKAAIEAGIYEEHPYGKGVDASPKPGPA